MRGHRARMTKRKGRNWLADSGGSNSRRTQVNAALDAVILDGTDTLRNPKAFSRSSDRIEWIKLREAGQMAFNQKEWMEKMDKAKTGDEITALVMELPDRGPPMTPDDPDYFFVEPMLKYKPSTPTTRTTKTKDG